MAAYAKKIAQNWVKKPVQFVLISNNKNKAENKYRFINLLNKALHYMFVAKRVQHIEPGKHKIIDAQPPLNFGLAK